eukprot:TRINITY_DN12751_c0_g1_i1.p1 TRINITY_DN12751_c0_g1~~TRINITY_DN12751_c0_g1_i1.p1  ORF type:complete len:563 (-),score=160.17 TRINITY_DN12751_c0_g1_i1:222-1910(-)
MEAINENDDIELESTSIAIEVKELLNGKEDSDVWKICKKFIYDPIKLEIEPIIAPIREYFDSLMIQWKRLDRKKYDEMEKIMAQLSKLYNILQALFEKVDIDMKMGISEESEENIELLSILLYQVISASQLIEITLWFQYNIKSKLIYEDHNKIFPKEENTFIRRLLNRAFKDQDPKKNFFDYLFTKSDIMADEKYMIIYYFLMLNFSEEIEMIKVLESFCLSFNFYEQSQNLITALYHLDMAVWKNDLTNVKQALHLLTQTKTPNTYSSDIIIMVEEILNNNPNENKLEISQLAVKYSFSKSFTKEVPNRLNESFCRAYLRILVFSGNVIDAYHYQRFVRSRKSGVKYANEFLKLIFELCKQESNKNFRNYLYKQILQINFTSEEEKFFISSFRDTELLSFYYLQGSRFLEVPQHNSVTKMIDISKKLVPPFLQDTSAKASQGENSLELEKKISDNSSLLLPYSFVRPLTLSDFETPVHVQQQDLPLNLSQNHDDSSQINESIIANNSFNDIMSDGDDQQYSFSNHSGDFNNNNSQRTLWSWRKKFPIIPLCFSLILLFDL